MAYNAPLLEYKIFPDGLNPSADTSDEAAAIYSAVAAKAKVILMALQGSPNAPIPSKRKRSSLQSRTGWRSLSLAVMTAARHSISRQVTTA